MGKMLQWMFASLESPPHPIEQMTPQYSGTLRKVIAEDLAVGRICADRDGNRVRIDRVDRTAGTLSYHFLNDELRVQEGIQERAIQNFLAESWFLG